MMSLDLDIACIMYTVACTLCFFCVCANPHFMLASPRTSLPTLRGCQRHVGRAFRFISFWTGRVYQSSLRLNSLCLIILRFVLHTRHISKPPQPFLTRLLRRSLTSRSHSPRCQSCGNHFIVTLQSCRPQRLCGLTSSPILPAIKVRPWPPRATLSRSIQSTSMIGHYLLS